MIQEEEQPKIKSGSTQNRMVGKEHSGLKQIFQHVGPRMKCEYHATNLIIIVLVY